MESAAGYCAQQNRRANYSTRWRGLRRRGRQNLFVLGVVLVLAQAGGDEDQVVVHLAACEDLAELGDEEAGAEMAGELGERLDVVGRRFTHQVALRPVLARLGDA